MNASEVEIALRKSRPAQPSKDLLSRIMAEVKVDEEATEPEAKTSIFVSSFYWKALTLAAACIAVVMSVIPDREAEENGVSTVVVEKWDFQPTSSNQFLIFHEKGQTFQGEGDISLQEQHSQILDTMEWVDSKSGSVLRVAVSREEYQVVPAVYY